MGLLSDAAAMTGGRVRAIFLTAALSLVPAYLVGSAIVFLAAALAIVALGFAACVLPGLLAAFAFSLAAAAAMAEEVSGFAALHRSWQLIKCAWPSQLGLVLCSSALVVLLTQGLGRLLPGRAVLAHALLDAAVAAVILPLPVFASAVLYVKTRSAAEGRPVEDLRQYIRRTSEPG